MLPVCYSFQLEGSGDTKLVSASKTPITVQVKDNSRLLVKSEKGEATLLRSLTASDGIIHVLDGVI
jgi:hypothetical protein